MPPASLVIALASRTSALGPGVTIKHRQRTFLLNPGRWQSLSIITVIFFEWSLPVLMMSPGDPARPVRAHLDPGGWCRCFGQC